MMQDVSYLAISCLNKANMARSCKIFPRIFTIGDQLWADNQLDAISAAPESWTQGSAKPFYGMEN